MTPDPSKPLDGIDPDVVDMDHVDDAAIHDALSSRSPLVQQRGVEVCETLVAEDVDHVRPFLDELATLVADENAALALRVIKVLDAVAATEPEALEGRLTDLVDVLDSDLVDVQLTGATLLGRLVVERPDLVAPFVRDLIEAIRVTEPDPDLEDFSEVVDDPVTRQTLQEHEEGERRRRMAGRRTLANVVVAVTETKPESALDVVDDLVGLLDDVDPTVAGGAIDALAELAVAKPAVVTPVRNDLIECLHHGRTSVRARAVAALGELGDETAVPELRTVAETDDDPNVREIARETADFLAGTS